MLKSKAIVSLILLSAHLWAGVSEPSHRQEIKPSVFKVGDQFDISYQDLKKSEMEHHQSKARPTKGDMATIFIVLEVVDDQVTKSAFVWRKDISDTSPLVKNMAAFNDAFKEYEGDVEDLVAKFDDPIHILEKKTASGQELRDLK